MSADPDRQKKNVTSLLLNFFVPQDKCDDFVSTYLRIRKSHSQLEFPDMEMVELTVHEVKCVLDFSSEIDSAVDYDISVQKFVGGYVGFLRDMLDVDHGIPCDLSALINIDESLAAFELKSPKIPNSINAYNNFTFDYFVWHLAAAIQKK